MQKHIRIPADWIAFKKEKRPISVITAYDAAFAKLISRSPIDAILVGDSLGNVVQGHSSTIPVTLDEMIYHTRMVRRGAPDHFIIADMPLGTYHASVEDGVRSGIRLFKETGAQAVKLEGAFSVTLEVIRRLVESGVPVMGHAGLTPQSYLTLGGFHTMGKTDSDAGEILEASLLIEQAGAFSIVLELVYPKTAESISEKLTIPTIGIGSGPHTDGQVQVLNDLLGLDPDFTPRHAFSYFSGAETFIKSFESYHRDVQKRKPGP